MIYKYINNLFVILHEIYAQFQQSYFENTGKLRWINQINPNSPPVTIIDCSHKNPEVRICYIRLAFLFVSFK